MRVRRFTLFLLCLGCAARSVEAQPARTIRLTITVVDPSAAVVPGATVTVTPVSANGAAREATAAQAGGDGVATFTGIVAGAYEIKAEYPGFEAGVLNDVRVRPGDNRHVIALKLAKLQDAITVGQDPRAAASDRRGPAFGSALTREQIDALSDDPDEMRRQLEEMAGPGVVIRVDSFEGAPLPPKAMIRSIRVTRDTFAAENHTAGAFGIDIVTQPGLGTLRGGVQSRTRSGVLSGRSPFTPTKGPELTQDYGFQLGGPIRSQKSSFNVGVQGMTAYDTSNLNVALPGATRAEALGARTYRDRMQVFSNFDFALTRDQTLRIAYSPMMMDSRNLGIGAYDLPERAYRTEDWSHNLRIQEVGPLGRRFFINTRLALGATRSSSHSALEAPTIRVNDAFTSGGQQITGGWRRTGLTAASDVDYVRGIHSLRAGVTVDLFSYHSDVATNYLGTYTFASLADYESGRPASYTRRLGNPTVEYGNNQAGIYLQDDIRLRRNLSVTPGIRYEVQSHVDSPANVGPRFGVTWAPFKAGRTTLRGSIGVFYDWVSTNTLEQAARVDGFHQVEINVLDPSYPDPGPPEAAADPARYVLDPHLQLGRTTRVSAGVAHTFGPRLRAEVLYANLRGARLLRARNLNAPIDEVRPDPALGNVIAAVSDARSVQHMMTVSLSAGAPPPPPFGGSQGARWDWRRAIVNAFYTLASSRNNTDAAVNAPFSGPIFFDGPVNQGGASVTNPPPTGNLNDEWGPANNDVRHRLSLGVLSQTYRNLNVGLYLSASSGTPYTVRTGNDDNHDAIFNDRPAGVGRNTLRGASQWTLNLNLGYGVAFGHSAPQAGPAPIGVYVQGGPGGSAPAVTTFTAPPARFRVNFFLNAQNLLNHDNYGGYSGTLTSPFFGVPTLVLNPRKVDAGIGFLF